MRHRSSEAASCLFLLNLGLQVWDGVATYQGLQLGWGEGNPLLRVAIAQWGAEWALLGAKASACGLLLFLHVLVTHPLIPQALILTAVWYLVFSFLPWLFLLFLYQGVPL